MERNLDIDSFEQLLKERSDEFKMYPEKRVWHSIYNNIHPGKKWPSVAMSITLIAVLLLTGYLNTGTKTNLQLAANTASNETIPINTISSLYNPITQQNPFTQINQTPSSLLIENSTFNFTDLPVTNNKVSLQSVNVVTGNGIANKNLAVTTVQMQPSGIYGFQTTDISAVSQLQNLLAQNNEANFLTRIENNIELQHAINTDHVPGVNLTHQLLASAKNANSPGIAGIRLNVENKNFGTTIGSTADNLNALALTSDVANTTIEKISGDKTVSAESEKNQLVLSDEDKNWIENYALYNRPAPKKWVGKLARQFYFTPSVIYRELKNVEESNPSEVNKEVLQHPSFGVELGTGIIYPIFKGVKIKAGVQLNYTRYNADAFTNSHPVATTITLLASESGQPYPAFRSTSYSNVDGITTVKLHNETFQISLPVGLDLKIAGNDVLQWNIGATIQPTYVAGGKSFLLSSDKRNYIKETSLLNRWNLNAGFETFVSYKTGNGVTFQFGPQFRKQVFTTNSKQYIIQEKLNNFGFKFGITKLIK